MPRRFLLALAVSLFLISSGCWREHRSLQRPAPDAARSVPVTMSKVRPGPSLPIVEVVNPSDSNAYDISEGQRLYSWYNCVGCHAHGGGGIGPALMDDKWIYGSEPENIHDTIVEGRPNGMPAFGGKIPDYQIWEIAAYVRSMSGLTPKTVRPARADEMQVKTGEQSLPAQAPRSVGNPR